MAELENSDPPLPAVVLVEPPCLVAGWPCDVDVHLSQEVTCASGHEIVVKGEGDLVVCSAVAAAGERVVRITLPPFQSASLSITIDGAPENCGPMPLGLLALNEDASNEFRRLFDAMVAAVAARTVCHQADHVDRQGGLLDRRPVCELAAGTPPDGHDGTPQEVAWRRYFAPLCAHYAHLLHGLAHRKPDAHVGCVPTVVYLLENELWAVASFLLKACMQSGASVTLGPFALQEEDVEPERLRRDYSAIGHGGVLLVGEPGSADDPGDSCGEDDDGGGGRDGDVQSFDPRSGRRYELLESPFRTWVSEGLLLLEPMSG